MLAELATSARQISKSASRPVRNRFHGNWRQHQTASPTTSASASKMFEPEPETAGGAQAIGGAEGRYRIVERLGEGKHGIVLKAIDQLAAGSSGTGDAGAGGALRYVAIKRIALRTRKEEVSLNAVREIKVLQCCEHRNIVSLLDMYPDLCGMALVFDYLPHTLYTRMKAEAAGELGNRRLDPALVRSYFGQLLDGLAYMHEKRIMHRDIKPANILIDDTDCLKIADFGLSRLFEPEDLQQQPDSPAGERNCYSPQVASRWYRAPELLWGSPHYGPAVDLWAAGCVLAEMLRDQPLFSATTDIEQLALVIQVLGTPTVAAWPELHSLPDYKKITFPRTPAAPWPQQFPCPARDAVAIRLVAALVVYNPRRRLTAAAAREHEYFAVD